jgi:hypothetical protein
MKTYIPVPPERPVKVAGEQATHFKVTVDYTKGGINYFTYKTDPRGYYLYASPVIREQGENGIGWERTALTGDGSGFKFLLRPATRLNRKTLDFVETVVAANLHKLTEPLLAADREVLLSELNALRVLTEAA